MRKVENVGLVWFAVTGLEAMLCLSSLSVLFFSSFHESTTYALSLTITKQLDSLELKSEDLSRMKQLVKVLFVFSYEKLIQFIAGGGHL